MHKAEPGPETGLCPGPVLIPEHEAQAGGGRIGGGDLRWAAAPGSHAPHTCIPGEGQLRALSQERGPIATAVLNGTKAMAPMACL